MKRTAASYPAVFHFSRFCASLALTIALVFGSGTAASEEDSVAEDEGRLLSNTRQLTFEGKRAGEGYFSRDGSQMVFQSERQADNPFYQIYRMDLETGDINRVSPGHGKTTCAWIHPYEKKVLFASTHADPESRNKQQAELDFRASGQTRRYTWDYDEYYDLYEGSFDGGRLKNLTNALGYDAEGSYSPDGQWIAFASNRHAYAEALSAEDAAAFERDKAYLMDIYLMRADGSDLRRLTDVKGYDGGPFFSPDGKRITWRRFSEDGVTAEVYTMNVDGSEQRPITQLGAMSWAPYFHPSGDYIVFATNIHGFGNFELYMVDAQGHSEPVRVTATEGFDGLPVFSPGGETLSWTSNRTSSGTSQIFVANWNDAEARRLLGLGEASAPEMPFYDAPNLADTTSAIRAEDLRLHVTFLASEQMEGRRTGTEGERRATAYVASVFESFGLAPAGDGGTYFQEFEFTAGVSLGDGNALTLRQGELTRAFVVDEDWRPLAYSKTGLIDGAEIVFAGYGIVAPGTDDFDEYDSYTHLDVNGKWVMVFRYMPEDIESEFRQHLGTRSGLRFKAATARDLGARGLMIVSGPNANVKQELVRLAFDASLGGTSLAAISMTNAAAQTILDFADKDLKALQDALDTGEPMMGFSIPGVTLEGILDIQQEKRIGRNVLARLYAGHARGERAVVIGAHVDHLGRGPTSTSLARDSDSEDAIHYGADDNASGVAGILEIAQYLAHLKAEGALTLKRDVLFGAWSGEELGLLGATHFTETYGGKSKPEPLTPELSAYLNMDMIGRLDEQAVIQGADSSSIWPAEVERRNVPVGLAISLQKEIYIPSDATAFYLRGVPFLSAFTGAHEDYHTPRDTADKINYEGAEKIVTFMALVARSLATRDEAPDYVEQTEPENLGKRANLRAYLGTIPDYVDSDLLGLKLSGVSKGGPADQAGLKGGDIIVELGGKKIENIYDYTFAIEAMKIGEPVEVVVHRGGDVLRLTITPGSRE